MQINYEDERFQDVKVEEQEALTEVQQTYDGMLDTADSFYEGKISEIDQWTQKQQNLQQEQTDFAVEQLQQQKEQAQKDYIKEQSGAYTDWKKQSSQHGTAAEQMAGAGMAGSGYSESSHVAMYTAYQNRLAAARESFTQAALTYDNAMKEARLQGSAAMAEIALQGFQQQLELSLQGFQYENQLIQQLLTQKQQTQDRYYGRWQDVLAQLNQEAALNEEIRQFNEQMGLKSSNGGSDGNTSDSGGDTSDSGGDTSDSGGDTQVLKEIADALGEDVKVKIPKLGIIADLIGEGKESTILSYREPGSVEGHGKLIDTQDTAELPITQNGRKTTIEQPVRKAEDGTLWVWNPQTRKYVQVGTSGDWRRKER